MRSRIVYTADNQVMYVHTYCTYIYIYMGGVARMVCGLVIKGEWKQVWSNPLQRRKASFNVGQEAIRMAHEYKYLRCVVDEYLGYKSMIEARGKAGMKAL